MRNKAVCVALALFLAMVMGCTSDAVRTMGSVENPDGSFGQRYSIHSRDAFGREIIQIEDRETASVYNPVKRKYEPKTTVVTQGSTGGATWEAVALSSFIGNTPQAAGDIFGAWILRNAWKTGNSVVSDFATTSITTVSSAAQTPSGKDKGHKDGHKGNHGGGGQGGGGGGQGGGGQGGSHGNGQGNGQGQGGGEQGNNGHGHNNPNK